MWALQMHGTLQRETQECAAEGLVVRMKDPRECKHDGPLWLEGNKEDGWRVRCMDCWTFGPKRDNQEVAIRALKDREQS